MHPVHMTATLNFTAMKKFILLAAILIPVALQAQNAITSNFVEGGKTLVELIRVIRSPKPASAVVSNMYADSCGSKKLADISFKNKTDKTIRVLLFIRIGNTYDTQALSLKLSPMSQESLYDIKTGIYKYRIESETGDDEERIILHEGELKLQPCDKTVKEIRG